MKELELLEQYLRSDNTEKSEDHLIRPIFSKIFGDRNLKKESQAQGADLYLPGRLIVEFKTKTEDWLSGFYQALHYSKKGLTFSTICVITHKFIGVWKLNKIPPFALALHKNTDPHDSPSSVGVVNSRKTNKGQQTDITKATIFVLLETDFNGIFFKSSMAEFVDRLKNIDIERQQVNQKNFIQKIELLKRFFIKPMDSIHCFYTIAAYWDVTATVPEPQPSKPDIVMVQGKNGRSISDGVELSYIHHKEFRKFVESCYIFTDHESGIDIDYYFSRFDEVISRLDPEYTKQHGIFFTDINLSKFALWFIHHYYEKKLSDKYIVFDPAGGSGNLIMSWGRNHLKNKIVSELQPDLLKIIERRMKENEEQVRMGFTIVPKTVDNRGLNFLNISAKEYLKEIKKVVEQKNINIDKPFAFLLNPPYKNTDENEAVRESKEANYVVDSTIVEITGDDVAKERYSSFLAQILNISRIQVEEYPEFKPLILIFTPTSWLIPRPTYIPFREKFDRYFKFEKGFIFTGNEFFKIPGAFPISFTIWKYNRTNTGNKNKVVLYDFTHLISSDLNINWNRDFKDLNYSINKVIRGSKKINFSEKRFGIKEWCGQAMYDFKRDRTKEEKELKTVGGLPLRDERRNNKKTYGILNSEFIGEMDDGTPVRIKAKEDGRFLGSLKSVWFRLDNDLKSYNKTRILNGSPDKYGYSAFNLDSAQKTFTWFALTKSFAGRYPIWANQFDIWKPKISNSLQSTFYSLCFVFGLIENRCVVTKFEKDNPVKGAPEVFVDNPLCPTNLESFWSTVLHQQVRRGHIHWLAKDTENMVVKLYEMWNTKYCKGEILEDVGLKDEPYFKYFSYKDFLTPFSGLIQIRKYAVNNNCEDLLRIFEDIAKQRKELLEVIYRIIVKDFKYFD